jgi:hypothetical protein
MRVFLFRWLILKMRNIFIIITFLVPLSALSQTIEEYQGGRPGFSSVKIILYGDSTYKYSEWIHTRATRKDSGRWEKKENYLILSSLEESFWKDSNDRKGKKVKKSFLFKEDKFKLENNTLKLYPEKKAKDTFYVLYYTLKRKE